MLVSIILGFPFVLLGKSKIQPHAVSYFQKHLKTCSKMDVLYENCLKRFLNGHHSSTGTAVSYLKMDTILYVLFWKWAQLLGLRIYVCTEFRESILKMETTRYTLNSTQIKIF